MPKPSNIKLKAVLLGVIVDNMGTLFLMTLLASALASTGIPEDEVTARMKSTNGLLLGLILGLGCTFLGGYVAGRTAKQNEVLHGALVAAVGMLIAFIFRESGIPAWFDIIGFGAMLPVGIAGGKTAEQQRKKEIVS